MNYLTDQGYRIPDDVSISGFDDNILSHVVRPRLATVHQDVAGKAEMAVKKIDDLLMGNAKEPVDIRLNTRIIRGASVKNIKIK
jgi:LacI family transcriptional regulator